MLVREGICPFCGDGYFFRADCLCNSRVGSGSVVGGTAPRVTTQRVQAAPAVRGALHRRGGLCRPRTYKAPAVAKKINQSNCAIPEAGLDWRAPFRDLRARFRNAAEKHPESRHMVFKQVDGLKAGGLITDPSFRRLRSCWTGTVELLSVLNGERHQVEMFYTRHG